MMITHDVDEAIYMSDRICMMTNGPEARVGQVIQLPFAWPRTRSEILEDPYYYDLRGNLVTFLELQDHNRAVETIPSEPDDDWLLNKQPQTPAFASNLELSTASAPVDTSP